MTHYGSEHYYKDSTVCNEVTTTGMREWSNRQQRRYRFKSNVIQRQLREVKHYQNAVADKGEMLFQRLISKEIVCWQRLEETLMHFNTIAMDILEMQNGGGTIMGIVRTDNQRELSYIQYACIKEDKATLYATNPLEATLNGDLLIDSLYIEML
ncbi:MAG: hypothetical protein HXO48_09960 [Prevotella sp.]|nr:hypothetical protein [Prevotella sp.]